MCTAIYVACRRSRIWTTIIIARHAIMIFVDGVLFTCVSHLCLLIKKLSHHFTYTPWSRSLTSPNETGYATVLEFSGNANPSTGSQTRTRHCRALFAWSATPTFASSVSLKWAPIFIGTLKEMLSEQLRTSSFTVLTTEIKIAGHGVKKMSK